MSDFSRLSRRERQLMQIIFARRQASVQDICSQLPDPPTPMAVRRMLAILQDKGHLRRIKRGREFVYLPRQSRARAGLNALRQVLETFFDSSAGAALATHLQRPGARLTDDDVERLSQLIDELKRRRSDSWTA
jgi:BlaI family transcriptional regulator, penicillinase repressor